MDDIRSKPYTEHGRQEHERIFRSEEDWVEYGDIPDLSGKSKGNVINGEFPGPLIGDEEKP